MSRFRWMSAPLIFGFLTGPAQAQKPGDLVVVLRETPVKREKVVGKLLPGQYVEVYDANGEWIWVSAETTGWILKRNVGTP